MSSRNKLRCQSYQIKLQIVLIRPNKNQDRNLVHVNDLNVQTKKGRGQEWWRRKSPNIYIHYCIFPLIVQLHCSCMQMTSPYSPYLCHKKSSHNISRAIQRVKLSSNKAEAIFFSKCGDGRN